MDDMKTQNQGDNTNPSQNSPRFDLCAQCTKGSIAPECANCHARQKDNAIPSKFEPQSIEGQYLKEILKTTNRTQKAQMKQVWYVRLIALCTVIMFIGSLVLVNRFAPVVMNLAVKIDTLAVETQIMVKEISNTDFNGLVDSTKELVESSSTNVETALEKINSIDIQALNESINALAVIVKPLAAILGG